MAQPINASSSPTPPTSPGPAPRNPRAAAQDLVGPDLQALVLEPSPPASTDPEWWADDPVAPTSGGPEPIVPTGLPGRTWNDWLDDDPARATHAPELAAAWVGGPRRIGPAPSELITTRLALHRLAAYVIAPVRHRANSKFGLRWTRGGFGTPFFVHTEADGTTVDRQIRVEGTTLVDQRGGGAEDGGIVHTAAITTLAAAAEFLGGAIDPETAAEHDSPPVGDVDETLQVDQAAARFLGDLYGLGFAALETLRADPASIDPSRPQLWPGHFDPAIEVGDEDHRGSYGLSPGDDGISEPYAYFSIWYPDRVGATRAADGGDPFWNAPSFTGAVLAWSDLVAAAEGSDPVKTLASFWLEARDRLMD